MVIHAALVIMAILLGEARLAAGQTVQPPYNMTYTITDLGSVPGVPTNYGGLTFKTGDPDTILIGGAANNAAGNLYAIAITRDSGHHISGFSGTASIFTEAAYNDGGVAYGPGGVLFLARWPVNQLGETKPSSSMTDKIVDLGASPLNVTASPGGLNFVPAGYPGAGQLKVVSYNTGNWYTLALASDGSGTYGVTAATLGPTITGGPEGFVYVPPGSPAFTDFQSILVSEYGAGVVSTYTIDANGDPVVATRAQFITGLTGAEGAQIDPVTGDFLFSTFGGTNHMVAVHGFAPPPTTTTTSTVASSTTTSTATSTTSTSSTTTTRPPTTTTRPPTTTTSTSTTSTTTSTTLPGTCPSGANLPSILCREQRLRDVHVAAESQFTRQKFFGLETNQVDRLLRDTMAAEGASAKKAKRALKSALRDILVFIARLDSPTGKHALPLGSSARETLLSLAGALRDDIKALRKVL